jgi:hypothetical protein
MAGSSAVRSRFCREEMSARKFFAVDRASRHGEFWTLLRHRLRDCSAPTQPKRAEAPASKEHAWSGATPSRRIDTDCSSIFEGSTTPGDGHGDVPLATFAPCGVVRHPSVHDVLRVVGFDGQAVERARSPRAAWCRTSPSGSSGALARARTEAESRMS